MKITADDAKALCSELESGTATAESLFEACSTRAGANTFFKEYLVGEWTCADDDTPPAALTSALVAAPESSLEVILLSVVQGAAAEATLKVERGVLLVNALWDESPVISQSCRGLRDAVDTMLGAELQLASDASQGNEETVRMMWANLLSFMNLADEEFARARDALARCGSSSEDADEEQAGE